MLSIRRIFRQLSKILQQDYEDDYHQITTRPDIDREEAKKIFTGPDGIERDRHFIVHYCFEVGSNLSISEVAARIAIISSIRTLLPLSFEDKTIRLRKSAKVLLRQDNGQVIIGYPSELISENEGLGQLLLLVSTGAEYIFANQFWIDEIEFPKIFLERFYGPKFGVEGIRNIFNVKNRPILGLAIEPIYGTSLKVIIQQCRESLLGGVDCIVDDVLLHDPDTDLAFNKRVPELTKLTRDVSKSTAEQKLYVVNVGASINRAIEYAKIAQDEGAGMIKVNGFTMGLSAIEELSNHPDIKIPIITTNMGVSLLTRSQKPYSTGISEAVMAKFSRLAGADGYHLGSVNTGCFIQEYSNPAIIALQAKLQDLKPSMIVIQGDITIANAWDNLAVFGPDIIMESCSGILGFPDGARKGAQSLRKLVETVPYSITSAEAHEQLLELERQDPSFRRGLIYYGYNPRSIGQG